MSALALCLGCALAAWQLRRTDTARAAPPGALGLVVPWLASAVIVWLLTGLTRDEWIGFGACLLAGSAIYFVARRSRRAT